MDSVEFIENFVRVRTEYGPRPILLNDTMVEMVRGLDENAVIGRYPRVFGKTTVLMGYTLHQMLIQKLGAIGYISKHWVGGVEFLKSLAYAYHALPKIMQTSISNETADHFQIGGSVIYSCHNNRSFWSGGRSYDLMIFDEPEPNLEQIHNSKRTAIIGTFKINSNLGNKWTGVDKQYENWVALPSTEEQWKVDALLSICNPVFSRGY